MFTFTSILAANQAYGATASSVGTPATLLPLHMFLQGVTGLDFVGAQVFVRHIWFRFRLEVICPTNHPPGEPPSVWIRSPPCGRDIQVRYTVTENKDGPFAGPTNVFAPGSTMATKQFNLAFRDQYLNREDRIYKFEPVVATHFTQPASAPIAEYERWDVGYRQISGIKKYKIMRKVTLLAGTPPAFIPDWDLQMMWQGNGTIDGAFNPNGVVQVALDGRISYTDD